MSAVTEHNARVRDAVCRRYNIGPGDRGILSEGTYTVQTWNLSPLEECQFLDRIKKDSQVVLKPIGENYFAVDEQKTQTLRNSLTPECLIDDVTWLIYSYLDPWSDNSTKEVCIWEHLQNMKSIMVHQRRTFTSIPIEPLGSERAQAWFSQFADPSYQDCLSCQECDVLERIHVNSQHNSLNHTQEELESPGSWNRWQPVVLAGLLGFLLANLFVRPNRQKS